MTFKIDDATLSLIDNLTALTGKKIGDSEMPTPLPASNEVYAIISTIPGGQTSGGMAGSMEMATIIYQFTIVGHTRDQCRKFQQMIHQHLDGIWFNVAGCMGPARVTVGGIVKEDERTFVANDTVYMDITQTEEA